LEEEVLVMKRIRLLVLAGAVAVALPFGMTAVGATGKANAVSIHYYADYDVRGTNIDVGLDVRCTGSSTIEVVIEQWPPETASHVVLSSGIQPMVVCDGQTHATGVTVICSGCDVGRAYATATVRHPVTMAKKAKSSRWIYIREV
jgi:hypothetical protein